MTSKPKAGPFKNRGLESRMSRMRSWKYSVLCIGWWHLFFRGTKPEETTEAKQEKPEEQEKQVKQEGVEIVIDAEPEAPWRGRRGS